MNARYLVLAVLVAVGSAAPLSAQYPVAPSPSTIGQPSIYSAPVVTPAAFAGQLVKGGSCDGSCGGSCGNSGCCVTGGWCHRGSVHGEFLLLRARDSEIAYAVPFNGPIIGGNTNTVQVGPVGVLDMDLQTGFRFGYDHILSNCAQFGVEYTMLESTTSDSVLTQFPFVIRSHVSHPNTDTAGQSFLQANASYDLNYDLLDFNYRQLVNYCDEYQFGYVLGTRLVQHEQRMDTEFLANGSETVLTDIDFYGAGLRAGLEYERYVGCQWTWYAKGYGNLIAGEFRADYDQRQSFGQNWVVDTSWKAGRIVTIWELELGMGWTSKSGWCSASAGYMYSAWTNMVQTDEWIEGVHQNNFIDMDSTSTFDGLVGRFEVRF